MFHHFSADYAPTCIPQSLGGQATIDLLSAACLPDSGMTGWRISEPAGQTDSAYLEYDLISHTVPPGGYFFLRAWINVRKFPLTGYIIPFSVRPNDSYWAGAVGVRSTMEVYATNNNGGGDIVSTSDYAIELNRWHMIDVMWKRETTDTAGDGDMRLWLDGELKEHATGINSFERWDGGATKVFRIGLADQQKESIVDYGPITIADFIPIRDNYFPIGQRPPAGVPYRHCNIP